MSLRACRLVNKVMHCIARGNVASKEVLEVKQSEFEAAQEKAPEDTDRTGIVTIRASPYPHRSIPWWDPLKFRIRLFQQFSCIEECP